LRSPLPTEFNPSVISLVYSESQILSVYTDGIMDEMLRIKKGWFADVDVIAGIFYWRNVQRIQNVSSVQWRDRFHWWKCWWNHRGIHNSSSVRWRALFTVRIADGITDGIIPSVNPSAKVNTSPLCRPSPPKEGRPWK